jgi:hypothetical protein
MKILQAVSSAVVFMGLAVPLARSVENDQPNVVVDFAKSRAKPRLTLSIPGYAVQLVRLHSLEK